MSAIGQSVRRPDVDDKVTGRFVYAADRDERAALHVAHVRSPLPFARVVAVDPARALALDGVVAVITADDLPEGATVPVGEYPVLAADVVRYAGEPVALVVAEDADTAHHGADLVAVDYDPLVPVLDPATALDPSTPEIHVGGNLVRRLTIARGTRLESADSDRDGRDVVREVSATWSTGRQDPAFLGLESVTAVPDGDGLVIHAASQDLVTDQQKVCELLGLDADQVRMVHGGMGGAFGGREDLSCQAQIALAALVLGQPVTGTLTRAESFVAHAKRHPATIDVTLGATADGTLTHLRGQVTIDAGAHGVLASSAVLGAACYFLGGCYRIPNVHIVGEAVHTNNPSTGAMRGFGAPQACFAIESTIDLLAAELGIDPVELRRRNLLQEGDPFPTSGQTVRGPAPIAAVLDACVALPMPDVTDRPFGERWSGDASTARGVGVALGVKNLAFGEGVPEWCIGSVRIDGDGVEVRTSAAECGQGVISILAQVAAEELGDLPVRVRNGSSDDGYSGASSASRQTWMSGSAIRMAARQAADAIRARAAERAGIDAGDVTIEGGKVVAGSTIFAIGELLDGEEIVTHATYHAPPTQLGDPSDGQGDVHLQWMFSAHRAVVDVDTDLGLVGVVQLATAQDVGVAINPREVHGQMVGGSVQGLGLAVMEHLDAVDGVPTTSFDDYLLPTTVDAPRFETAIVEEPDPRGPYGAKGVGEPPTVSSAPAIAAAVRAATGRPVPRIPIRPEDCISPDLLAPER